MGLNQALKAILMTAGAEKQTSAIRWNFTLADNESKFIPFYFQDYDNDADQNTNFRPHATDFDAMRIDFKSRCSGGYYNMSVWNTDTNGALIGLTKVKLTMGNIGWWNTAHYNSKAAAFSGNLHDTLYADNDKRRFVPHIKYVPLAAKQMHYEDGNMPTGHGTNPHTSPFVMGIIVSNFTPLTTSSLKFQIVQNYNIYTPGTSTATRDTTQDESFDND